MGFAPHVAAIRRHAGTGAFTHHQESASWWAATQTWARPPLGSRKTHFSPVRGPGVLRAAVAVSAAAAAGAPRKRP